MRHLLRSKAASRSDALRSVDKRCLLVSCLLLMLPFAVILSAKNGLCRLDSNSLSSLSVSLLDDNTSPTFSDGPEICLVYDRPPRTGSSTAGRAFQECWDDMHFNIVNKERLSNDDHTIQVLVKSGPFVAATSYHFIVTDTDIVSLTTRCKNLFYVTSTRPLRERIISTALGSVEKHTFTMSDNVTLNEEEIPVAMSIARKRADALERKLESYPYRNTEERITPDYIIRYQNFAEDLAAVLKAFGCSGSYESVNIHILNDSEQSNQNEDVETANKRLQDMQFNLTKNDSRHVEMSKLAELVNPYGLVKAARLAKLRRSTQLR